MRSPVLFLVFNRPDTTQQVFDEIKKARPPKLYIAADGPRTNKIGEVERCNAVKAIVKNIDWPCVVSTKYNRQNLGCKKAVSSAITWFFENEAEGIILEDDVLPSQSFFAYCDELLEKYRDDFRVGMITGFNPVADQFSKSHSYGFTTYPLIWGWASWRSRWKQYDITMKNWPRWNSQGKLYQIHNGNNANYFFWFKIFNKTYHNKIDTWDYQWVFANWLNQWISIIPKVNLIKNIGFGEDATHTTGVEPDILKNIQIDEFRFPVEHPDMVAADNTLDKIIVRDYQKIKPIDPIKFFINPRRLSIWLYQKIRSWV